MNRLTKWAVRGALGLGAVAVIAVGGVYAASEAIRTQRWDKAPVHIVKVQDDGAVARGARLATVYGCHDCHGQDLTGRTFHEDSIVRITGANLTLAAARQSDEELARAIRMGVAADGRGLWVMPSEAFATLTDAETADLIAYLRTFKSAGPPRNALQVKFVGRLGVVLGKFRSAAANLADHPAQAIDLGPAHAQGRSLSRACMECHGTDLKGGGALNTPDLTIAATYSPADFERLMHTGVASADRRLPMMGPTAEARFKGLSHEEISALHAYLKARAEALPIR